MRVHRRMVVAGGALVTVCGALVVGACMAIQKGAGEPSALRLATSAGIFPVSHAIYDPDPGHLWNRLHAALWIRTDSQGQEYGADRLDPLLWNDTRHLINEPSHSALMQVLAEFEATRGENLKKDSLHRAMLQRDLWSILDWSAGHSFHREKDAGEKERTAALQRALVRAMSRVALSAAEIKALPDNYAAAVAGGKFAPAYDPAHRDKPFLPADLFDTNGQWICVADWFTVNTPRHTPDFGERSVFLVFLRLPGGRQATLEYLDVLRGKAPAGGNLEAALPEWRQVPVGTQAALVRRMVLVDDRGELVPTRMTESVQFRVARGYPDSPALGQDTYEFELRRKQLFAEGEAGGTRDGVGETSGLHARGPDEHDFVTVQLQSTGLDEFEWAAQDGRDITKAMGRPVLQSCIGCHSSEPGLFLNSLQPSRTRREIRSGTANLGLEREAGKPDDVLSATLRMKREHFSWGLLQGIRMMEKAGG